MAGRGGLTLETRRHSGALLSNGFLSLSFGTANEVTLDSNIVAQQNVHTMISYLMPSH
jgi:hypothetical protein